MGFNKIEMLTGVGYIRAAHASITVTVCAGLVVVGIFRFVVNRRSVIIGTDGQRFAMP